MVELQNCFLLQILEDAGCAHAAAYTHGHHAVTSAAALQLARDGGGQLGSGASQGMAESDRSAIRVDLCRIQSAFLDDCQRLRRESLVQLEQVDVGELEPGQLQHFWNRKYRPESHLFGLVSGGSVANEAQQRLQSQRLGPLG